MSWYALSGSIEQGLVYGILALGVYITFRVLNFPDLTVEGSFPLGAAVSATLIVAGWHPLAALGAAAAAGMAAGLLTGLLHTKMRITGLLAGILTMTALYSINLRIMGGPNIPLIMEPTVFNVLQPDGMSDYIFRPLLLVLLLVVVKLLLDWYFSTQVGLAMRATGSNPRMARAQGVATGRRVLAGMALSNALCALAGALFAQSQGGADISMGIGTIVIGLAAVIIGESIMPSRRFFIITLAVIVGAILYRFFVALALNADFIGLHAQDLNLVTALLVTFALVMPMLKQRLRGKKGS